MGKCEKKKRVIWSMATEKATASLLKEKHTHMKNVKRNDIADIEPINLEADIEGGGPSFSSRSVRPSSSDATKKKNTAMMVMEEMRDDFLKATAAMMAADEKGFCPFKRYVNNAKKMKDAFIDFLQCQN